MSDLANLQIRVQSIEAELADKRLDDLAKTGAKAEKATNGLTSAFLKFAGPAALVAGSVATLSKVVSVTREFGTLNAQLITATGSAENAGVAFEAIQDFASSTPYDLQQVTEAFTKLVNLGLTPSEAALTSYGNTASAMGKDLNQLIEAVADAATGEFERLKEFGIQAKSQGDQVSFTFRGVTTTVGKNAAEIEAYLQALGENEFAGAMAERMDTLDGALSNLGDEWDKLFLNISNQGIGDVIKESVRIAIDVLTELNAMLASGQIEAYLDAIAGKFEGFGRDVATTIGILTELWNDFLGTPEGEGLAGATSETLKFIIAAFKNLPENIRAVIQLMAVEIGALVDYGKAYGQAFGEVLGSEFAKIVEKSKAYGQAIGQAINPFDDNDFDLEARLRELDAIAADMADNTLSRAEKQAAITTQARRDSIVAILEEREAALSSFDTQIAAAETLRKKHDEELAARKANSEDRLAGFKVGADGSQSGETDQQRKAGEAREKELEDLRKSLRTEEEVIQESYDARLAIIIGSTEAGSTAQSTLTERLNGELALQKEKLATSRGAALEGLRESLRTEEEVIQESYNKRLEIILANTEEGSAQQAELKARLDKQFGEEAIGDLNVVDTYDEQLEELNNFYERRKALILENSQITEEERTALEEQLTAQRNERLAAMEAARTSMVLNAGSQIFGGLADLSKQFAGEQSGIYKTMFAASKAFAVADSVVKIQTGIASAAALPFPANLGAIGSVISATSGIVSTINGTNFSGAMDAGGIIPQGKVGLVGEFGPELVAGPTNVRSRRDTAEMFKAGKEKEAAPVAPPQVNVRNINVLDPAVVGDYLATDAGEQMIMNVVQRNQRSIGF